MYRLAECGLANIAESTIIGEFNTHDTDSASQKFKVTITETLERTVEVEAGNQQQAERIVFADWRLGGYILDASDFTEVEFKAVPGMNVSDFM